jgi:hypothetical protein
MESTAISVRLTSDQLAALDKIVARMLAAGAYTGLRPTRSDAIRHLVMSWTDDDLTRPRMAAPAGTRTLAAPR